MTSMQEQNSLQRFILDIGSGDHPRLDATHLCDLYVKTNIERGGPLKMGGKPFVRCAIDFLPFKDNSFILNYACHVLEHARNPFAALSEVIRVSQAGYLETPTNLSENIFGWTFHRWVAYYKGGKLFFGRRRSAQNKIDMHTLYARTIVVRLIVHLMDCMFGWHCLRIIWKKDDPKITFKKIILRNPYRYFMLTKTCNPLDFQFLMAHFRDKIELLDL
jgi:hypothetical protein